MQAILLEMPNSTFVDFMAEIGAKLDRSKGTYFVDCEHATTLPALNIRAGTQQFTFQFHDYVDMVRLCGMRLANATKTKE